MKKVFGVSKEALGVLKEPFGLSKEAFGVLKEPFGISKEAFGILKEPFGLSKIPFDFAKNSSKRGLTSAYTPAPSPSSRAVFRKAGFLLPGGALFVRKVVKM